MTNAEKLAKDTDFLAQILYGSDFCRLDCDNCVFAEQDDKYEWCVKAQEPHEIKEWLESEANEDDRVQS